MQGFKQGAFVDTSGVTNNKLFNALITAAVRDKMAWTQNFGMGTGSGVVAGIVA